MSVAAEMKAFREATEELRRALLRPRRELINDRVNAGEVPDPVPLELPVGFGEEPSMRSMVQEMVRGELSQYAADHEMGTFAEEDDFEEENPELLDLSGYEVHEFGMVPEEDEEDPAPPVSEAAPSPETAPAAPAAASAPTLGAHTSEAVEEAWKVIQAYHRTQLPPLDQ